jgi:hypothetical protein
MADPANSLFDSRDIDTWGLFTSEPETPSNVIIMGRKNLLTAYVYESIPYGKLL